MALIRFRISLFHFANSFLYLNSFWLRAALYCSLFAVVVYCGGTRLCCAKTSRRLDLTQSAISRTRALPLGPKARAFGARGAERPSGLENRPNIPKMDKEKLKENSGNRLPFS